MTAGCSLAIYMFVTPRLGTTTHCHYNFGYCFGKSLILRAVVSDRTGTRYALEGKVVYSR